MSGIASCDSTLAKMSASSSSGRRRSGEVGSIAGRAVVDWPDGLSSRRSWRQRVETKKASSAEASAFELARDCRTDVWVVALSPQGTCAVLQLCEGLECKSRPSSIRTLFRFDGSLTTSFQAMDHGGMDHGGHTNHGGGHGGMSEPMACKMSMIWNTDPVGHCLVFPLLQITRSTIVLYLTAIVLLAIAAEYLRLSLSTFDRNLRSNLRGGGSATLSSSTPALGVPGPSSSRPNTPGNLRRPSGFGATDQGGEEALLGGGPKGTRYWGFVRLPWVIQLRRSVGYTALVALGYYLHLLVMSYNAQIIAAVLFGIFLGHFIFQRHIDLSAGEGADEGKGLQCH
ncbi:hypothetical protein BMF94_0463 [Rhodotorula taiwanensis]|uniref:Copper transport protein n=1 Tax=Rhodotorula taiwanensis TaxID=741276 RepID=A0A2S5BHL5_9BASI|nr:hypothetical protein BMF94_0463 [Rhodotorula taiwanensis]